MSRSLYTVALALCALAGRARADDCEAIAVWSDGKQTGSVCRDAAAKRELLVIDLSDGWTPLALAPGPAGAAGAPGYRASYLALASERFGDAGSDAALAPADRYFELFGIAPSFAVVRARLADDSRHRCHEAIDDAALAGAPARLAEEPHAQAAARIASARALRAGLAHDQARARLPDLDALAATTAYHRRAVARLASLESHIAAVRALQAHLACDGLFRHPPLDGEYTWQTSDAVERFARGEMILPSGIVDTPTLDALRVPSRERAFRTALRVLRERVVAATGLIEDGTAGAGPATVLGRALEPEPTWRVRGHLPLEAAAPDLISAATETVARALGWRDPATALGFLDAVARSGATAVAVPQIALPAYHGAAIALAVEIDRGEVWRDPAARWRKPERRPALIVYAVDGERRIALVRWPTTIGGWQWEKVGGGVARRWKESPTGPRVWRDLFIGPRWLPPASTPDRELVRRGGGRSVLARELLGPSYRAAFGMIALVHLRERTSRTGVELDDQGIRTHGTGNLASLASGVSHGCHRLLGRNVVRLAGFIVAHRAHVRHGETPTYYRRVVRDGGAFPIAIDSLGYRIELVPPIPVNVLPGQVRR